METFTVTIHENRKRLGIKGICAPTMDEAERALEMLITEYAYPKLDFVPECIKFYIEKNGIFRNLKLVIGGKRFTMMLQKVGEANS